jgi:leucyl aminopeptidase
LDGRHRAYRPDFRFARGDKPTNKKEITMEIQTGNFGRRALPALLAVLLAGLFASGSASAQSKKSWITLGDAAFTHLQKVAPQAMSKESRMVLSNKAAEKVHLVEVDDEQMRKLSAAIHNELRRCGGFMFHTSEMEGKLALDKQAAPMLAAALARPTYVIDNQTVVSPVLTQMQASNIAVTIADLASFVNRYYTTTGGTDASNWLKAKWEGMATGRSDITVAQFAHTGYNQKSVILTIAGTDNAAEVVVLGGHLDSISGSSSGETTRAPGADDDASGIASMTEALRALIASGYKPRRTIKMIGYAAEEVGLRGSQAIAQNFKANNVNVVGVMQLDMTNYKGSAGDIYIYTDYTDSLQNDFVAKLITTYQPTLVIGYDRCGYGCSDHASWTAQGYYASMPFESSFNQDNPYIHTANDTYANSGNQANHALKFAKLAASFAIELGSDGAGVPSTDRVENFSGALTRSQTKSFGPFKVGASGSLKAETTGTGDTDLYVRKDALPTTSSYTCKSDGATSTEACTVTTSTAGDVYVLLKGYTASTYNLKVTYKPQ